MSQDAEDASNQDDPRSSQDGRPERRRDSGGGRDRRFGSPGRERGSDGPRGGRRREDGPRSFGRDERPRRDGEGSRGYRRDDRQRGERAPFRADRRDDRSRDSRDEQRSDSRRDGGRRFDRRDDDRRGSRDDRFERRGARNDRREDGERRSFSRDNRPPRDRESRGFGGRDGRPPRDSRSRGFDRRDDRSNRSDRGNDRRDEPRIVGPEIPEGFDARALPFGVRAELRGLSKDRADQVSQHIWAAGELIDENPELAFEHAETARQLAPRLAVVREAAAETAYAAGKFDVALREYRAIRRMAGGDELIPVIADCLRAVGKPREALETLAEMDPNQTPAAAVIESLIIEAGARNDLGQRDEALRLLKTASGKNVGPTHARARLWYAYADLLLEDEQPAEARLAFAEAASLDHDGALDSSDRMAELDGFILPDSLDLDEEQETEAPGEKEA